MPRQPRDEVLELEARNRLLLDRIERRAIRGIEREYERARRELRGSIQTWETGLSTRQTSAAMEARMRRDLARDQALLAQVEARMLSLREMVGQTTAESWREAMETGRGLSLDELEVVSRSLDLGLTLSLARIDYGSVEVGMQAALARLMQEQERLAGILLSELRVGLILGQSFDDLARRLLARDSSVFARGRTSAMLGARRTVIYANNAARQLTYEHYSTVIPGGLQKQAIAAIDGNTTECCLGVHGQVQPVGAPYRLSGTPRFAGAMMHPPFHWNCRTSSVAYRSEWERGSKITTRDMTEAARAEQAARAERGREEIHPAHATSRRQ